MYTFYSRILVAYDGSELSKKALEMTKKLANQDEKIEIHVVSVVTPINAGAEFGIPYEHIRIEQQKKVQELLDDVKVSLEDLPNKKEIVMLKGRPAEMIVDYAKNRNTDLLVIGSRGLSTFKEIILGSVSHNVVQHAPCPVLVAK
ncbi:universal stress protein [Anaerobacillus sp. MEB173]|uniref:universal stress protein n=1 Tax=Anaerobacillus sp. MEB173 TaxID=3383345 RepID=UPI003F8E3C83